MLFFDNDAFNRHFGNVRISAARMVVLATQNGTKPCRITYVKSMLFTGDRSMFYMPSYC